ncbi:glycosyltransferase [Roseovarius sp. E0-M6]|uniref:glycosyltransferase n=1 Tax=Roseovarius sp. E0-M6 TaxID=3127118 RepID=UPI0030101A8D
MRIWTSVIGQRLDDAQNTRSMLLCDALLKRGHEVVMWTSAYDHIHKKWRPEWREAHGGPFIMDNGLEVRFMKGCGYSKNMSPRRFLDHWLCGRDFLRQASDLPAPDAVVASIPDHLTADALVKFARRARTAAIVDVRDKWPDIFIDYAQQPMLRAMVRLALLSERRRAARTLGDADAIVGMMGSMVEWGLERAGRPSGEEDRVFYLTTAEKNFGEAPVPDIDPASDAAAAIQATEGRIVFSFTGTFNRTQHPLILLDALDILKKRNDPALDRASFIIGGGGVDADRVRTRAAKHENVALAGWLKSNEMAAILRASDVGLLLMNFPSPAFNNKAFSYLASGIPIINCATGDLADLLTENEAGMNVRGGDALGLAEAISKLTLDDALRTRMRGNIRVAYDRFFDRDANYIDYAKHIERVIAMR